MVGLARGRVELEEYSTTWADEFEQEKERLLNHLDDDNLIILHVGSTAIPGMVAKPIIDILLISDHTEVDYWNSKLEELGYHYRENGGNEDSIFFARGSEEQRTHYLRITYPHSRTHISMVYFRDTLRANTALAQEYRDLKVKLAQVYPDQRTEYTKQKEPFVIKVLSAHPHLK